MDIEGLRRIRKINKSNNNSSYREYLVEQMSKCFDYNYDRIIDGFEVEINSSKATVGKRNFTEDIRFIMILANSNTSTEYKYYAEIKAPVGSVHTGDYLTYIDNSGKEITLLIQSIPEKKEEYDAHETSYALYCNQTVMRKGFSRPYPCYATNSSYGVKGEVQALNMSILDGKMLVLLQKNEETNKFKQNERILFDHSSDSVYKTVDTSSVPTPDLKRLVLDKTEFKEGYDDLTNNIAWNVFDSEEKEDTYFIDSANDKFEIMKNSTTTFRILKEGRIPTQLNWNITVNTDSIQPDYISIEEVGSDYISIKNLHGYDKGVAKITFTNEETIIEQEIRLVNY